MKTRHQVVLGSVSGQASEQAIRHAPFSGKPVHNDSSNVVPMPGVSGFSGLIGTGGPFAGELAANAALLVFDQLTQPILMCDQALTICYQNNAAEALLTSDSGLQSRHGQLSCVRDIDQDALLSVCADLPWEQGDSINMAQAHTAEQQAVRMGGAGTRNGVVLLARLISMPLQPPVEPAQLVMLQIHHNARGDTAPSAQILRRAYRLTRAESAVAMLISDGFPPAEIAAQRQVSVETIRAQLRVLYAKTGTKRQAELVRLVHCLSALT